VGGRKQKGEGRRWEDGGQRTESDETVRDVFVLLALFVALS
jgi:hypothetical protein